MFRSPRSLNNSIKRVFAMANVQKCSSLNVIRRQFSSQMYTWGIGDSGQLGHAKFKETRKTVLGGATYAQILPRRVQSGQDFDTIAIGDKFTLGVNNQGYLYGFGQFWGLGNKASQIVKEPTAISLDPKWVSVSAGKTHGAAIDKNGQVYTFGAYEEAAKGFFSMFSMAPKNGWLGHPDSNSCDEPRIIESFRAYGAKAKQIACGDSHTIILTEDGEVLTCGVGEYGRLGTGILDSVLEPTTVESLLDHNIVYIAAGSSCSFALTDTNILFSWGKNNSGQLGIADSFQDVNSAETLPGEVDLSELVLPEGGGTRKIVKVVAVGGSVACLTDDGKVYQWGQGLLPTPSEVILADVYTSLGLDRSGNGDKVVDLAIGGEKGSCLAVLTENGKLFTVGKSSSWLLARTNFLTGKQPPDICAEFTPPLTSGNIPKVIKIFGGRGNHMACITNGQIDKSKVTIKH